MELSKLGDSCAELESKVETWLTEHDVVFNGATIPFVLMPHFVSPIQVKRVKRAVTVLCRVLDRFCDAYATNDELREELAVPEWEERLIRIDPGFPRPMRICRLDAFLQAYDIKFLEFNSDSPAGIGYTDVLYEGLTTNIRLPKVRQEFDTSYAPMLPELMETLLDAYAHVRAKRPDLPETPRMALLDAAGSPAVPEFRITCKAARERSVEAVFGTLDDVTYDGSALHVSGQPVHLVYRRAMAEQIGESDLVAAARDGSVCIVNPFRARVANNKKLLALMSDPRFADIVGDDRDVVEDTVPWTRILRPGRAIYGTWTIDLLPFVADNRERLVLKPASDYGGQGVSLGMETDQVTWEGIINDHAERGDFIVQEYVPVPEEMFPTVEAGHVQMRLKRFNINPFGIGGRYAGSITRISDRAVINVSAGGGLLPSVIGRHKRRLLVEDYDDTEEEVLDGQKP